MEAPRSDRKTALYVFLAFIGIFVVLLGREFGRIGVGWFLAILITGMASLILYAALAGYAHILKVRGARTPLSRPIPPQRAAPSQPRIQVIRGQDSGHKQRIL